MDQNDPDVIAHRMLWYCKLKQNLYRTKKKKYGVMNIPYRRQFNPFVRRRGLFSTAGRFFKAKEATVSIAFYTITHSFPQLLS